MLLSRSGPRASSRSAGTGPIAPGARPTGWRSRTRTRQRRRAWSSV